MIYLYGYFAIGVVVLVVVFTTHLISREHESEFVRDMLGALYPERITRQYRLLNNFVVPTLAVVAVVVLWPVAVYMKGREVWENKNVQTIEETKKKFAVTNDDLLETLSIQEIEARERVFDPLGAVPDAPFGHLNPAWLKFKATMEPMDSLSSFYVQRTNGRRKVILTGYVIVRSGHIGAHLLTSGKRLPLDQP